MEAILKFVAKHDLYDYIYWNEDLEFFILCNDVFTWACSDLEPLCQDDLSELEKAIEESDDIWGPILWIARKRKIKPISDFPSEKIAKLFDEIES